MHFPRHLRFSFEDLRFFVAVEVSPKIFCNSKDVSTMRSQIPPRAGSATVDIWLLGKRVRSWGACLMLRFEFEGGLEFLECGVFEFGAFWLRGCS